MFYGIRQRNYQYLKSQCGSTIPDYKDFLQLDNLKNINAAEINKAGNFDPVYHKNLLSNLKVKFPNCDNTLCNYSQSWQDIFVLTMLQKNNGTYLELGASEPEYMNNTLLLDSVGFTGISIDFREELKAQWNTSRPNSNFILANVWDIDFNNLLKNMPAIIDYLQVDLDETCSLMALKKLPTNRRFRTITFETDLFQHGNQIQDQAHKYLESLGYKRLLKNVAVKDYRLQSWQPFEDWYVDPDLIDKDLILKFFDDSDSVKLPHRIFIEE